MKIFLFALLVLITTSCCVKPDIDYLPFPEQHESNGVTLFVPDMEILEEYDKGVIIFGSSKVRDILDLESNYIEVALYNAGYDVTRCYTDDAYILEQKWLKGKFIATYDFTLKKGNEILLHKRYTSRNNLVFLSDLCSYKQTLGTCFVATMEDISNQLIKDLENFFFEKKLYLKE